jgi:hypothetical protein
VEMYAAIAVGKIYTYGIGTRPNICRTEHGAGWSCKGRRQDNNNRFRPG